MKTSAWPLVSIIVNNFKGTCTLERCLFSVQRTNYPAIEIIVVDCLTKDIEKWLEKKFPTVEIVHFNYDIGLPAQRNAGLAAANLKSKYIAFLDNDTVVDEEWLFESIKVMETDQSVRVVQPKLLKLHDPEKVDGLGGYIDFIGYAHIQKNNEVANQVREISYAEGAAIIVRREIFKKFPEFQKPFDSDYFFFWEDIDLCWLVRLSGYKVLLVPKSIVYHERGVTSAQAKLPPDSIFLNSRNRIMTLIKNYSLKNLAFFLPISIMFELVKVVVLLRRRSDHAIATIRGITWNIKNFRYVWRKHLKVQLFTRRVPDSYIIRYMLQPNIIRIYQDFRSHYGF